MTQSNELGGEGARTGFKPAVHARGVGFQYGLGCGLKAGERRLGGSIKTQCPHETVDADRAGAQEFREPSRRQPALGFHLPKPVLRMGEAQGERRVPPVFREDVGDFPFVEQYLDRSPQQRIGDRALRRGKGGAQPQDAAGAGRRQERQQVSRIFQNSFHPQPNSPRRATTNAKTGPNRISEASPPRPPGRSGYRRRPRA